MKKLIAFVIRYSLFVILLCPSAKAQWEGAEVQRMTHDDVPNTRIHEFCIDENDNLYLFYVEGIRDTATGFVYRSKLLFRSKGNDDSWSQPEETGSPEGLIWGTVRVGYDVKTGITHLTSVVNRSLDYDTVYYTNSEMPDWQLVKIDSLSNVYGARYDWLKMTFDTLRNVHLTWHVDYGSTGVYWYKLMYANNSTGQWVRQQITPPIFLGGYRSGASYLTVQTDGSVHIVYHGDVGGSDIPYYYVRNDSLNSQNWHRDTIPRPSRPFLYYGGGPIKVDVNDRVHLITGGCIENCTDPGHSRSFYYYRQAEDSIWIGPDLILDSLSAVAEIFIDDESVPYLLEWDPFTYCWFFTDRTQGFWQEPYQIFDTTSMCNALSSILIKEPSFVLDSEGRGQAVFSGALLEFALQDDSLEIFYFGAPFTSVEDTSGEQREFSFELLQNYPNPFNSVTSIQYTVSSRQSHPIHTTHGKAVEGLQFIVHTSIHTTLKIYNILGKEVRELVNTTQCSGDYTVTWDGKNNSGKEVSSGIYFYQLRAGDYGETKKLVLIK